MSETTNEKQLRELIRLLERKLGALEEPQISCCSITFAKCHAIVEIGRAGSLSLNELAEILNLDNSTMSRTVNNLVNSGLVRRETDPRDRRFVTIRLTQSGMKVFDDIETNMNLYYKDVFSKIPENKRAQVLESLGLLLDALSKNNSCKK